MANEATLKELTDRALDYADMAGSDFPDPDRLTGYVNTGLSELHDLLVNTYEDYFLDIDTFVIVAGQETYALPDDYYKTIKLFYITSGRRFKIERWSLDEIDGYRQSPITGGDIQHFYVPQLKKLRLPGEKIEIAIPIGWEDFVALSAARKLLLREESDIGPVSQLLGEMRQRLINMSDPRDAGEVDAIADYYGRWEHARHLLRFDERYFKYRIMGNLIRIIEIEYLGV